MLFRCARIGQPLCGSKTWVAETHLALGTDKAAHPPLFRFREPGVEGRVLFVTSGLDDGAYKHRMVV